MASFSRVLVTGGAGFLGSHIVDKLMEMQLFVRVVDNLTSGKLANINSWLPDSRFEFMQGDLKTLRVAENAVKNVDAVFHFAANPEVRVTKVSPSIHFQENLLTTFNVLEAMRKSEHAKTLVFASSSTIYGEPTRFPTPEDYGPLYPISVYGASKLGCESLISSYSHTFGLTTISLRLANIVGGRSNHGVIVDFIQKLRQNPTKLEILGDGTQRKSYVHVTDLVDAVILVLTHASETQQTLHVYNIGSFDQVPVRRIAEIVSEEMDLPKVDFKVTGGVNGGRGWMGDVKTMLLTVDKLKKLGWTPALNSSEAVRRTCREILKSTK